MIGGEHRANGITRSFRLFVPDDRERPRALVVMLHGCGQDAESFAEITRMNEAAAASGLAVLYPEQSKRSNAWGCWNWFRPEHQMRGGGEPALLAGLTRRMLRRFRLTSRQATLAGFSAGGGMAMVLRRTYPGLFGTVAVHSGLATGLASDGASALAAMRGGAHGTPPAPIRHGPATLLFQGGADEVVHAENADLILGELGRAARGVVRPDSAGHVWFGGTEDADSGCDATRDIVEATLTEARRARGIWRRLRVAAQGRGFATAPETAFDPR